MNDKKLILIGGGGHCKSVLSSLSLNIFSQISIVDQGLKKGDRILNCEVIGEDKDLKDLFSEGYSYAFITIGSVGETSIRRNISEKLINIGYEIINIIDESANVDSSAILGKGIYIGKNAVVNPDSKIGDFCIINTCAVIEHDCKVGAFSHIAPGAIVCGSVNIGDDVHIGANSTIRQGVRIASKCMLGAGGVLLEDTTFNSIYLGVPAKKKVMK